MLQPCCPLLDRPVRRTSPILRCLRGASSCVTDSLSPVSGGLRSSSVRVPSKSPIPRPYADAVTGKPPRSASRNYPLNMGCAAGRELDAARCEAEKERAVSRERELAAKDREVHALQSALLVAAAEKMAGAVLAERTLAARDIAAVKAAAAECELRLSTEKAALEQRLLQSSHGAPASHPSPPSLLTTAQIVPPPPALQRRALRPALPQPTVLPQALSPMRVPQPQALPPAMRRAMPSALPPLRRPAPLPPQSPRSSPPPPAAMASSAASAPSHTTHPHQPSGLPEPSKKRSAAQPQPHGVTRRTTTPTLSSALPVARDTVQPDISAAATTGGEAATSSSVPSASPIALPVELELDFFLSHYQATGGDQVSVCCSLRCMLNALWAAGVGIVALALRRVLADTPSRCPWL